MPTPRSTLFDGLDAAELEEIFALAKPRRFAVGDVICQEGDEGRSLFILQSGLAKVMIGSGDRTTPAGRAPLARLRPGDVIGELSLLTGAPRTATVVAMLATEALELGPEEFSAIQERYAVVRDNLIPILSERLVRTSARAGGASRRGEVVGLLVGRQQSSVVNGVIDATRAASPRSVADMSLSDSGALATVDQIVTDHGTVLVMIDVELAELRFVLEHMDRVVALVASDEVKPLIERLGPIAESVEIVILDAGRSVDSRGLNVIRVVDLHQSVRDTAWLGRHLSRTKLGLALGAGGAKGFAHIAALYVLEELGYTVDYVAGSSAGAMVGCWLALGMDAAGVDATLRREHRPDAVAAMFKLSFSGLSSGVDVMVEMFRRTTKDRTFADLQFPLGIMTVDLDKREPALITQGPLWRALLAATALPGMFPPYDYDGRRLVDGLALVPVPTDQARQLGADIVISVNLLSREMLPAWPGMVPAEPAAVARSGARLLDSLLDVMELAQLDSSVRHAARADIVLTPRFGPGSWRDYHLADLFLGAGREVAQVQLAQGALREMARPQILTSAHKYGGTDDPTEAAVHV